MLFVTGHGDHKGIDAVTPITPHKLVTSLKKANRLEQAIVYLGQCFAGVFNYVKAGRSSPSDRADTNIILIGATNLQESVSLPTSEQFPTQSKPTSWSANLFLLNVFKWLSSPIDIDGDGLHTIMDSYKYAGVHSNLISKNNKIQRLYEILNAYGELKVAEAAKNQKTGDISLDAKNELVYKAIEQKFINNSNIQNIHQESWILNSRPAQNIKLHQ